MGRLMGEWGGAVLVTVCKRVKWGEALWRKARE